MTLLYTLLGYLAFALVFVCLSLFVWQSNKIISERNELRRRTGKYYDFDITQELKRQENEKQAINSKRSQTNGAKRKKQNANASAEGLVFDKSKVKHKNGGIR